MASPYIIISSVRHQGQKEYMSILMAGLPLVTIFYGKDQKFQFLFLPEPYPFSSDSQGPSAAWNLYSRHSHRTSIKLMSIRSRAPNPLLCKVKLLCISAIQESCESRLPPIH